MSDIRSALVHAEEFLKQAAASTGEHAAELREKGLTALRQAKEKAQDLQEALTRTSKEAVRVTDDYVHAHPWKAVAIAAGLGVLIGLVINRK